MADKGLVGDNTCWQSMARPCLKLASASWLAMMAQRNIPIVEDDITGELMFEPGRSKGAKRPSMLGIRCFYCVPVFPRHIPGLRTRLGDCRLGIRTDFEKLQTFTTLSGCSGSARWPVAPTGERWL